jgi:hypothetical protein
MVNSLTKRLEHGFTAQCESAKGGTHGASMIESRLTIDRITRQGDLLSALVNDRELRRHFEGADRRSKLQAGKPNEAGPSLLHRARFNFLASHVLPANCIPETGDAAK